ncbi:MAG: tetratricopeptide repeat protein, partial [bacterium]
ANPWHFNENVTERTVALQKALALRGKVSARERAYIHAAHVLDSLGLAEGREAYVQALGKLIAQYPEEVEAKLFLALFLFQDNFTHGYDTNGEPTANRKKSLALLEDLLKAHPNHAAVNHYWIHAVEGGAHPEAALASADKIAALAPASGHMVHMAGHIYFRLGMYERARQSFLKSMKVDEAYLAAQQIKPDEHWNYSHNLFYLAMNCAEDGRYQEGLKWARLEGYPETLAAFLMRYGKWEAAATLMDSLAASTKNDTSASIDVLDQGLRAFVKGMAALEKRNFVESKRQADELDATLGEALAEKLGPGAAYGAEFAREILSVASPELRGNVASMEGDHANAIAWLKQAVEKEKQVGYDEPPLYTRPSLESLGQAYLRMREWEPARAAFQQALKLRPNSGHALYGIAQSYAMAGKKVEAEKAYRIFLQSWCETDESLLQVQQAKAWLKANGF